MKKLLLGLVSLFLLVGCSSGGGSNNSSSAAASNGYVFTANGQTITMNQQVTEDDMKKLGEYSVYEAPSCAFGDLDRTYTYGSFTIDTYTLKDVQYIKNVILKDDTVDVEGLSIGSSKKDVTDKLGTDFTDKSGSYVYTKGDSTVTFMFTDDVVADIMIDAVVDL